MNPALSLVGIATLPCSDSANASTDVEGLVGGRDAADDLDELHDLRRVEEVQARRTARAARSTRPGR